jgi:hypothetical protein
VFGMSASAAPLRAGVQLASAVCTTRVVVVRAPADGSADLRCGGEPMVPATGPAQPAKPGGTAATLLGKRYVDANDALEVLCTASGAGELSCDGVAMALKAAKALPASD